MLTHSIDLCFGSHSILFSDNATWKQNAIPWPSYWRSGKNQYQPRMLATSRSLLLPIHLLSSSTTVSVPLLYWLFCRKIEDPLHSSSLQHLQTASAHNCSSIPHHNSAPPLPRVISLHVHSVAAAIHSFLCNISHTPRERFPMHFHAVVMERQPPQKEMANKANLTSKIRKCSHWCGDLISCYIGFRNIRHLSYMYFQKNLKVMFFI